MKDTDKKKQFIELRAKNHSFQKISQEIGVSKTTLIKWSKEFDYEITNLSNLEMEALYEEHKVSNQQRIEYYGKVQDKILKELETRDMKDVRTDKLLDMLVKTSDKLKEAKGDRVLSYRTPEEIEEKRERDKRFMELSLF